MAEIITQSKPTMYFFGVTTGQSSSKKMFPYWANILGLGDAQLVGVDLPINAPAEQYRHAVRQIVDDPLSMGALVTSHKINVLHAARDMFNMLTPDAELCDEVSSIYKRNGKLIGHAVDPINSGESMIHFLGEDYFRRHEADIMCLGAGGSAVAMLTHMTTRMASEDQPRRVVIVNRSKAKLDNVEALLERLPESHIKFELIQNSDPVVNDGHMANLPPHSMVINATGMGKDIPGSPITDAGLFPQNGIAWELNYRGALDFLHQAKAQQTDRNLLVEDGWTYFLLGWSSVVSNVFDVEISEAQFTQLAQSAAEQRGG